MNIDDRFQYVLEPLKQVDVKTLTSMAETLKRSKDKKKRALGVFLDRLNKYRLEEPKKKNTVAEDNIKSKSHLSSGLKDLKD